MSGLEKFKSDVAASEELASRFRELAEGIAAGDGELSPAEVQVRAAAELGYDLDISECEISAAEAAVIDEGELERVAGGGYVPPATPIECKNDIRTGRVEWCWGSDWGCYTTLWNTI